MENTTAHPGIRHRRAPERQRGGARRRTWLLAAALALGSAGAVSLAGCGADDSDARSNTAAGAAQPAAPEAGGDAAAGKGGVAEDAGAGRDSSTVDYRAAPRSIIYTGTLAIQVNDVDKTATDAIAIATTAGGYVDSDQRNSSGKVSTVDLRLRIPAKDFTAVVERLAGLGEQLSRDISSQDVTDEVVDLDARIAAQQASLARTRALFAQAKTIAEIVSIESELSKRESDLAALQARKRELSDQTELSTITLRLTEPQAEDVQPVADDDLPGPLGGLSAGWRVLVVAVRVLLLVLGFIAPFALVLGGPAAVVWWLVRRRRPTPGAPTAQPAATAHPVATAQPAPAARPAPDAPAGQAVVAAQPPPAVQPAAVTRPGPGSAEAAAPSSSTPGPVRPPAAPGAPQPPRG